MKKIEKTEWGSLPEFFGPRQMHRGDIVIKEVKQNIKQGKVLDAGCGNGYLLFRLSKLRLPLKLYGIEYSKKFYDYVKAKIKISKKNIKVSMGDITKIKYPKNSFDLVVSLEVLEHVKNDNKAVKELHRVLKKGGKCIVSVPADPKKWDITDEWEGHERRYTEKSLKTLFTKAGFKIKKIRYYEFLIMQLYHNLIYNNLIRRDFGKKQDKNLPKSFLSRIASAIFYIIFKLDFIFQNKKGSGLILIAEKP